MWTLEARRLAAAAALAPSHSPFPPPRLPHPLHSVHPHSQRLIDLPSAESLTWKDVKREGEASARGRKGGREEEGGSERASEGGLGQLYARISRLVLSAFAHQRETEAGNEREREAEAQQRERSGWKRGGGEATAGSPDSPVKFCPGCQGGNRWGSPDPGGESF